MISFLAWTSGRSFSRTFSIESSSDVGDAGTVGSHDAVAALPWTMRSSTAIRSSRTLPGHGWPSKRETKWFGEAPGAAELAPELSCEEAHVSVPIAKRGHGDAISTEGRDEVTRERAGLRRRSDDPARALRSDDEGEELLLPCVVEIGDLFDEQGAPGRTQERALVASKEDARDRGGGIARDHDERRVLGDALAVKLLGQKGLAHAALTDDEERPGAVGEQRESWIELAEDRAFALEARKGRDTARARGAILPVDREHRLAHADGLAPEEEGLRHPYAVDPRRLGEVDQTNMLVLDRERAVAGQDRGVREMNAAKRAPPDEKAGRSGRFEREPAAGVGAFDDDDLERRSAGALATWTARRPLGAAIASVPVMLVRHDPSSDWLCPVAISTARVASCSFSSALASVSRASTSLDSASMSSIGVASPDW